jgi:perosamine synthetase
LKKRIVDLSKPSVGDLELEALKRPINSGWLTQGSEVDAFEKEFATFQNVSHSIAVSSATTGLHLALLAVGVKPGDEVLVPSFTWVSTANAVLYCNAIPVLVDCDPVTFNVKPEDLIKKITNKTSAIIVVHLFGLCVDVPLIRQALPRAIPVIEDAACAVGASINDLSAGSMGDIGVFSFHPRKTLTTGEGGMITTNSDQYSAAVRILRNHGASPLERGIEGNSQIVQMPKFENLGYNYRLTDIQAAIGRVQLEKLPVFLSERHELANMYQGRLRGLNNIVLPQIEGAFFHSLQSFVILVKGENSIRDNLSNYLGLNGISTRPGTHAVHTLGYYQNSFGYKDNDLPGAFDCATKSLAIPLHNCMDSADVDYVCDFIEKWVKTNSSSSA